MIKQRIVYLELPGYNNQIILSRRFNNVRKLGNEEPSFNSCIYNFRGHSNQTMFYWRIKQKESINSAGSRSHQICSFKKIVFPSCVMHTKMWESLKTVSLTGFTTSMTVSTTRLQQPPQQLIMIKTVPEKARERSKAQSLRK